MTTRKPVKSRQKPRAQNNLILDLSMIRSRLEDLSDQVRANEHDIHRLYDRLFALEETPKPTFWSLFFGTNE
jgi:hypothetical protein